MVIVVLGAMSFYGLQKTIRPSAKRVVEDTLVDASRLVATLVASDVKELITTGHSPNLQNTLAQFDKTALNQGFVAWYDQKQHSQFHLYITDNQGVVIYDSLDKSVGKDFSKWNDVYLTLQGKYGARSSDVGGASVMYVASPIYDGKALLGVVSVGKPTHGLTPYIDASRDEFIKILVGAVATALIVSALLAMWFRYSIFAVVRFTNSLAKTKKPHFYLGRELNEMTDSIGQMKDTLENRAYVSEFVHTLTHELKSPLSAIRASSELLADEIGDDDRLMFANLIHEQSLRMTALIDRLLNIAKLEQPSFELNLQVIDLQEFCQNLLANFSAQIAQKSLTVQIVGDGKLTGDKFWLGQALSNLLDNAVTHAKSVVLIILKNQEIIIANDSKPLPDFVIKRAFERYFSFNAENTNVGSDKKGTGLGLPLVAMVAEKHGGVATFTQMSGAELIKIKQNQEIGEVLGEVENWVVVDIKI